MSHYPHRQAGLTLIGLLVGLVLSLIGILAMLELYRNLVQHAGSSIQAARLDGQLATGLLAAQVELQGAGFGLETPSAQDLQLLTTAQWVENQLTGLASTHEGNALVWSTANADGNNPSCTALLADTDGLKLLKGNSALCLANNNPFSHQQVLIALNEQDDPKPSITLSRTSDSCQPYGQGEIAIHPVITLKVENLGPMPPIQYPICLSNFAGSTP